MKSKEEGGWAVAERTPIIEYLKGGQVGSPGFLEFLCGPRALFVLQYLPLLRHYLNTAVMFGSLPKIQLLPRHTPIMK